MNRTTIFFDLDDTLYDRRVPYERAFRAFFGTQYEDRIDRAFDATIHRGYEVFTAAHTGKITMEAMYIYRHQMGLADAGISVTPEQALRLQALYAAQQNCVTLSETMCAALSLCKAQFAGVGIITNGGVESQSGKLRSLGAARWVKPELILISDAVGVMKPAAAMFQLAQKAAGGGACAFVGDSYTQDIEGAAACGWKTVWMNRARQAPGAVRPDFTAESEEALLRCLQALASEAE